MKLIICSDFTLILLPLYVWKDGVYMQKKVTLTCAVRDFSTRNRNTSHHFETKNTFDMFAIKIYKNTSQIWN